jgi:hypothetical protein
MAGPPVADSAASFCVCGSGSEDADAVKPKSPVEAAVPGDRSSERAARPLRVLVYGEGGGRQVPVLGSGSGEKVPLRHNARMAD